MRSPFIQLRTRLGAGAGAAIALTAVAAATLPATSAAVDDPPPGNWPTVVQGAVNPLIGTPFQVNGGGATADVRVRIWASQRRETTITRSFGSRPVLRGRVSNRASGAGIGGATLVVAAELTGQPGWKAVGTTRTSTRGFFRSVQPPGLSRRFAVLYYPAVNTVFPRVSRRVLVRSSGRVFMTTKNVGNRVVRFSGRVIGAVIPSDGLNVYVQVRNGNGYASPRQPRTDANGRFNTRYRFAGTRRRFSVRAFVPEQPVWPHYAGVSPELRIRVP